MLEKPRLLTPGPTPRSPEGLSAPSPSSVPSRTPAFTAPSSAPEAAGGLLSPIN